MYWSLCWCVYVGLFRCVGVCVWVFFAVLMCVCRAFSLCWCVCVGLFVGDVGLFRFFVGLFVGDAGACTGRCVGV